MADQDLGSRPDAPRLRGSQIPPGAAAVAPLMTRARWRMLAGALVAAVLVQTARYVLPPSAAVMLGLLVVGSALIAWRPEVTLSAMVTGAHFVDQVLAGVRLRYAVGLVVIFFAVAMGVVTLRRALRLQGWQRVRTALDWPMAIITGYALVSALVGLLRGNAHDWLIINSWHVLNWPLFYLVTTMTANTPDRLGVNAAFLGYNGLLQLSVNVLYAGERGGDLSLFSAPLLALLLLRRPPVARPWLFIGLGLSLLDALQSSFRSVWLSVGVAVLFVFALAIRRLQSVRALLSAVAGIGVLAVVVLVGVYTLHGTPLGLGIQESLSRSAGYRMAETLGGWQIFTQAPLFGWGFGHRDHEIWIPGLEAWGVGPVYHMFALVILTSQGIVGMALALWMLSRGLVGRRPRWLRTRFLKEPWAAVGVGLQGLLVGAVVSSAFSGPRISHYGWAVVPTLILLCARWGNHRPTTAARTDAPAPPSMRPPESKAGSGLEEGA